MTNKYRLEFLLAFNHGPCPIVLQTPITPARTMIRVGFILQIRMLCRANLDAQPSSQACLWKAINTCFNVKWLWWSAPKVYVLIPLILNTFPFNTYTFGIGDFNSKCWTWDDDRKESKIWVCYASRTSVYLGRKSPTIRSVRVDHNVRCIRIRKFGFEMYGFKISRIIRLRQGNLQDSSSYIWL